MQCTVLGWASSASVLNSVHIERLRVETMDSDSCVQREDDWGLKCALVDLV